MSSVSSSPTNSTSNDSDYRFYGCYQNGFSKNYKWECKMFDNLNDANFYCWDGVRDSNQVSTIVPIKSYIPFFMDSYIVNKKVKNIFSVTINK